MAFGIANPDTELHWFQNPPMSVKPEYIRPYTFSQISSRGALWEEDTGDLPQQTAGSGNITMDLSSKVSMGGIQNNQKYNFDVQSNPTSFVYNNQNINNFTAIPPAVQDAIYNNTTQQNNNYYTTSASGGATGSVTTLSNPVWDESVGAAGGNMFITFTSKTFVFADGLVTSITTNANEQITLSKLRTLSNWYNNGTNVTPLSIVSNVIIESTDLNKKTKSLTLDHGLISVIGTEASTAITTITTCS